MHVSGLQTQASCPHLHSPTDVLWSDLHRHWDSTQPTQLTPNTSVPQRAVFLLSSKASAHLVLFSFAYWQQIVPLLSKHFSLFWFNFCLPISCDRSNERTSLGSPGHAPKLTERDLKGPGSGGGGSFLLLMLINEHRLRSSAQLLQCLPH